MKVDFPLPESPITTNVSFLFISNVAPFMATVQPVFFFISCFEVPFLINGITRFGFVPKNFIQILNLY